LFSNPRIRNGSSATFRPTLATIRYSGVFVSPHPRRIAWKMKKPNIKSTPTNTVRVYSTAIAWTVLPGVVPSRGSSVGASA